MNKGLKRVCGSCAAKFYDMAKSPIICPKCSTVFTGEFRVRTRRARVAAAIEDRLEADAIEEEEVVTPEVEEEEELETVSLDEIVEDDDAEDDTVLPDDDDDLIDDDLDDDDDLDEDIDIDEDDVDGR